MKFVDLTESFVYISNLRGFSPVRFCGDEQELAVIFYGVDNWMVKCSCRGMFAMFTVAWKDDRILVCRGFGETGTHDSDGIGGDGDGMARRVKDVFTANNFYMIETHN